ncbi:acetyl-CoA carboxylase carboxyl transferase subunit beta, partial [Flavobacteriales bacterium]|nr:acetyl-CoA carboxylase carboxyl transferase subunit beta [Flavobacteriales bacterium]
MGWFKRIQDGITTKSTEKKEIPEGAWYQCPNCKTVVTSQQHAEKGHVCHYCDHHDRLGSNGYFELLFDDGKFREIAPKMTSADPLEFQDTKAYKDRLVAAQKKTNLEDALRTASGDMDGIPVVISCMDFS